MYLVNVCHRLLSCVVPSRPVIVYLVPMQCVFIATYLVMLEARDVRRNSSGIQTACPVYTVHLQIYTLYNYMYSWHAIYMGAVSSPDDSPSPLASIGEH